jgi:Alw26I/Eco31I/Esp3I family type II restriction m6 adenine DNA methyltransferase
MSTSLDAYNLENAAAQICEFVLEHLDETMKYEPISEIVRIIASNIIIAAALDISVEEVTKNPNLGIRESSSNSIFPEDNFNLQLVRKCVSTGTYDDIRKVLKEFTKHQSTKILEYIHALTVYRDWQDGKESLSLNGSNGKRKIRGAFYTPTNVSAFICEGTIGIDLDQAIKRASKGDFEALTGVLNASIIDPACGPGTFLIEALRVFAKRFHSIKDILATNKAEPASDNGILFLNSITRNELEFKKHIASNLYGVDIDSAAAEIASVSISLVSGLNGGNLKDKYLVNIRTGNSLVSEFPIRTFLLEKEVVQEAICYNQSMKMMKDFIERKNEYRKYRLRMHELEQNHFISIDGKRASELLPDDVVSFFSWELDSGFDYLVMNPPYDILKLNRSEYVSKNQTPEERRVALERFERDKIREKARVEFFRKSGQYRLSIDIMINLYRLMIERSLSITNGLAKLGFIVPSTIVGDSSSAKLRSEIIRNSTIMGIDSFTERAQVFNGITQAVSILRIKRGEASRDIPFALHKSKDIKFGKPSYSLVSVSQIEEISGNSMRIPLVSEDMWPILRKMHRWPSISQHDWIINKRGELDLTQYKQFIKSSSTDTKLIRGNHVARYKLQWQSDRKEAFVLRNDFIKALGGSEKIKHLKMNRIVGQQVSNMAQKWRLKFAPIVPGTVVANSCNYLTTYEKESSLMYLLALMNSHLLNWRFKLTSTNNHVNNIDLEQLPIISPSSNESKTREMILRLSNNAKILSKKWDMDLDRQNNALVFKLYGINEEEALTVLHNQGADESEINGIILEMGRI